MIEEDIIVALATPHSENGAIAVIRLSGTGTIRLVNKNINIKLTTKHNHMVTMCNFYDLKKEKIIDTVMITVYKQGQSYTKEESIEIACHNSFYIIDKIIKTLIQQGAHMASRGEFTKRAYLNGQFDLIQAESVADIIAAKNATTHNIAMQQLNGGLSKKIHVLKNKIKDLATNVNISIDFQEEDTGYSIDKQKILNSITDIIQYIKTLIQHFNKGETAKNGLKIAIIGKPNVGKSSLLNALVKEKRAIVSDIAGTTRDSIDVTMYIDDIKCIFIDTAGLRDNTTDTIEQEGIKRTKNIITQADLMFYVIDVNMQEKEYITDIKIITKQKKDIIMIVNKIDLNNNFNYENNSDNKFYISVKNHIGLQKIKNFIKKKYKIHDNDTIINARHYSLLTHILKKLEKIKLAFQQDTNLELICDDINECFHDIGAITGEETSTEDILDNIFKNFCIGK